MMVRAVVAMVLATLAAAGCGGGDESIDTERALQLERCPDPLVIQTDWYPNPEQGALFNLTGGEGDFEPETGVFSGPLAAEPSITVELRSGGRYLGNRGPLAAMDADPDIFLAMIDTDEAVADYSRLPTTAVVAPLDLSTRAILWDPGTYEIDAWNDVKKSKATISYESGALFPEYLAGVGLVTTDQLQADYDRTTDGFVKENGALMQQGSATYDPYALERFVDEWNRPVGHLLVHDSGYEIYQGALSILNDRLDQSARACLGGLVPLVQQAIVDFQRDPSEANSLILDAADSLGESLTMTDDQATEAVVQMGALGVVANGSDNTIGSFDRGRVAELLKHMRTYVTVPVPTGLQADDLFTNEFLDSDIRL